MSGFQYIDLSSMPEPKAVEERTYEEIYAENLALFREQFKAEEMEIFDALVESDPAIKLIQAFSFKELGLMDKINKKCLAQTLAFSDEEDLDHVGSHKGVIRAILVEADNTKSPPIAEVLEGDPAYRRRIQLSNDAMNTAGSEGAYIFHGLSTGEKPATVEVIAPEPGTIVVTYTFNPGGFSSQVKDISSDSPSACNITITVLGWDGDGIPSNAVLTAVEGHLSKRSIRPQGDRVQFQAAAIVNYALKISPSFFDGPDPAPYRDQIRNKVTEYCNDLHRLGGQVTLAGLHSKSFIQNVTSDVLIQKWDEQASDWTDWEDINCTVAQAPFCTDIEVA